MRSADGAGPRYNAAMVERVAVIGGSFDPVQKAHVALARAARARLDLSRALFVPVGTHALKQRQLEATASQRLDMLELALAAENDRASSPYLAISRVEIDRVGVSYTVDTLTAIRAQLAETAQLFFVFGADLLAELAQWREVERAMRLAQFVVCPRPSNPCVVPPNFAGKIIILDAPAMAVSSTAVRCAVAEGDEVVLRASLEPTVLAYIQGLGLYGARSLPTRS